LQLFQNIIHEIIAKVQYPLGVLSDNLLAEVKRLQDVEKQSYSHGFLNGLNAATVDKSKGTFELSEDTKDI
jgi:hypothetical protein